jgi:predicted metalloprotease with PDZ domain
MTATAPGHGRRAARGAPIAHHVEIADAHAHQWRVTLRLPRPAPRQRLSLPVWIPGSYLVREFARHLSALEARQGARPVALTQIDKTTWEAECSGEAALVVSALVYAYDPSVRAAYLDAGRGFFNGTSLCLRAEGREAEPHALTLGALPRGWDVATAMPAQPGRARAWVAADYDELVDHPFTLGRFWRGRFEAAGVPHEFVVTGAWPGFDGERLLADTRRICEAQIALWHGRHRRGLRRELPFANYLFMLHATEDGWGGLEHRASTALIAARRDLPRRHADPAAGASDGYVNLLGLISHEYFHAWNVKRLRPAELARIDYTRENHTPLLWFFEGHTAYYDDLALVRAGLIDEARYLKLLAKAVNAVADTPGRRVQSVAQASFDAWTKYYRPDENTPNATVNYYTKGALVALALDLALRGGGHGSLDEVLRRLWSGSGGGPLTQDDIVSAVRAQAAEAQAGAALAAELLRWVHGTDELPLAPLLAQVGLALTPQPGAPGLAAALGLRLAETALGGVQVKAVLRGSAAERAGVAAGDELLAVDGWRLRRLDDAQGWLAPGAAFELLLAREQRIVRTRVQPPAAPARALQIVVDPAAPAAAAERRRAWLGG